MTLWKKIVLIVIFLGVAVGFGYFVFRLFFVPTPNANISNYNINGVLPNANLINRPVANVNGQVNVNIALPNINGVIQPPSEVAAGGYTSAKEIIGQSTQDLVMAGNKKDIIYYDKYTGEFKKKAADGSSETLLTQQKYPQADKIYWSPARDKAVLSFPDSSKIVYDFNQDKQYSLPKETTEFSFSPSGNQIAYKYVGAQPDERWLAVSNPDGSGAQVVEALGDKAGLVKVDWSPNNQMVAYYTDTTTSTEQDIIFLGLNNENFPAVKVDGLNFNGRWSPGGDKVLYSISSADTSYNPTLWVMDGTLGNLGGSPQELDLQTWPDKCAFGSLDTIYCAVPTYLPSGSDLYPEITNGVADEFYKVDLKTGLKTLLALPVDSSGYGTFTADKIFLSASEDLLYFTDRTTGRLYQIRLK